MPAAAGWRPDVPGVDLDPGVCVLVAWFLRKANDELGVVALFSKESEQHQRGKETARPPGSNVKDPVYDRSEPLRVYMDARGHAGTGEAGDDVGKRIPSDAEQHREVRSPDASDENDLRWECHPRGRFSLRTHGGQDTGGAGDTRSPIESLSAR